MKLIITHSLVALIFLSAGIWYGYDRGVKNHIYFDSPARIAIYDAFLEEGSLTEHIEGQIWSQINLLDEMEQSTSSILLNHPIHIGMEEVFLKYKNEIEASARIQKIRNEIRAYNK